MPVQASSRESAYGSKAKQIVDRAKNLVEHKLMSVLPEVDQSDRLRIAFREIKSLSELPAGGLQAVQTTVVLGTLVEALVDCNVTALATGPERAMRAREQQSKLVQVAESFAITFEKTALPLADSLDKVKSLQRDLEKILHDSQKEAALISGLLSAF